MSSLHYSGLESVRIEKRRSESRKTSNSPIGQIFVDINPIALSVSA